VITMNRTNQDTSLPNETLILLKVDKTCLITDIED